MAGEAWVWLSATMVPTDGAQLAAAVVNPTESSIHYGVSGTFEHWSEGGWTRAGSWVTSLDHWGGFPVITPEGQRVAIPAIGLSAPTHGIGTVEYFSLPPLSEGLYRISHSAAAFGIIRVVADAPRPVPIDNPHPPILLAQPTLMQYSQEVHVAAIPSIAGVRTREDTLQFNRELAPSVGLYQWKRESWVFMTMLAVDDSQPQQGFTGEVLVTLPELPTGAYRLVRQSASHVPLARVLWVDSSLTVGDTSSA
jgi:hypothetical protein